MTIFFKEYNMSNCAKFMSTVSRNGNNPIINSI